ncbi:hypothetical protein [Campylobacter corcagiensis]|uniref:Uncharacterized protein n=1 Tax=Campylobacter corcagiensis TaxID=1448857 RepID=A0A7M1LE61_9BACT|nr:hypothetical protein [Campylobacter corcagiensis]QKF64984.1 hypothetical protein CCORG_1135 [Campylobacter corcagiensis]QOQ86859.1 hypothetical protein IMC76_06490 [Campylobacter corcagiensis]
MEEKLLKEEKIVEMLSYCMYYYPMYDIKNDELELYEWFSRTWLYNVFKISSEGILEYYKDKGNFDAKECKELAKKTKPLKEYFMAPRELTRKFFQNPINFAKSKIELDDVENLDENGKVFRTKETYFRRGFNDVFHYLLDTDISQTNANYKILEKLKKMKNIEDSQKLISEEFEKIQTELIENLCFLYLLREVDDKDRKTIKHNYILTPIPEIKSLISQIKNDSLNPLLLKDISQILVRIPFDTFNKINGNDILYLYDQINAGKIVKFYEFNDIVNSDVQADISEIKQIFKQKTPQVPTINLSMLENNQFDAKNIKILALIINKNSISIMDKNSIYKVSGRIFSIFENKFFLEKKAFIKSDDFLLCYTREFLNLFDDFSTLFFTNLPNGVRLDLRYFVRSNFYKDEKTDASPKDTDIFERYKDDMKNVFEKSLEIAQKNIDEACEYLYSNILNIINELNAFGVEKFKLYKFSYLKRDSQNSINFSNFNEFENYAKYAFDTIISAINFTKEMKSKIDLKQILISSMIDFIGEKI